MLTTFQAAPRTACPPSAGPAIPVPGQALYSQSQRNPSVVRPCCGQKEKENEDENETCVLYIMFVFEDESSPIHLRRSRFPVYSRGMANNTRSTPQAQPCGGGANPRAAPDTRRNLTMPTLTHIHRYSSLVLLQECGTSARPQAHCDPGSLRHLDCGALFPVEDADAHARSRRAEGHP